MSKKSTFILIFPTSDFDLDSPDAEFDKGGHKSIPMGALSVLTFVESLGYEVKFIDARLYSKADVIERINEDLEQAICVGFSIMTCQVKHGLILSDYIKSKNPEIPILWGGIHPTLFPQQTCSDRSVDYVISGEGEYVLKALLSNMCSAQPDLSSIAGLVYKSNGTIVVNRAQGLLDVNELPMPNYSLLDINKYIDRTLVHNKKVRGLDVLTSRGCPYRCKFCTNTILLAKKWRPLAIDKVISTVDLLVKKYNLNNIWFIDDFFFGKKERPFEIARQIIDRYGSLYWEADIRADNFKDNFVNDEYLKVLKQSGLYALRMGAESGSDHTLALLGKSITVEQTLNAVDKCSQFGIFPILFFMIGIPNETEKDAIKTISFIFRLKKEYPQCWIYGPALFRLYPGSELYKENTADVNSAPENLRAWGKDVLEGYLLTQDRPWLKGKYRLIDDLIFFVNMFLARRGQHPDPGIRKIFGLIAEIRDKTNLWEFRAESRGVSLFKRARRILKKAKAISVK